ncbi:MAG: YicC family protein [Oscillospiraceae bacterium]|nr:YicC family protein [Oscillospiraceae bacterium]
MTGYGRGEAVLNGRSFVVEVRSVNNRYLDCNVKCPREFLFVEDQVKKRVQSATTRGKVDVFITVDSSKAEGVRVTVNQPLAESYRAALQVLASSYQLRDDVSVSLLSRFPEVLQVEKAADGLDALGADLCSVVDLALERYNDMRTREGERLASDIRSKLDTLENYVSQVEARSPQTVAEYRARLLAKMEELLANTQIDESRILTEAALFADKVAVDEETVRLRSHFAQAREMISGGQPVGRKLDFLVQEINRETNTICSKGSDLEIARLGVEMKSEIEKIREQIQNLE